MIKTYKHSPSAQNTNTRKNYSTIPAQDADSTWTTAVSGLRTELKNVLAWE